MLAERVGPDGEVVGLDYSSELIQRAEEAAGSPPWAKFHTGSIVDIDYPADRFDASRADRVLQHLDNPAAAIDELKRVTKPGGRIGLTDTAWDSLLLDAPGEEPAHRFLDLTRHSASNPEIGRQLYRHVREAGLEDIDIDPILFHSTNFEEVRELGRLETWLERMQEAGLVTEREIEDWLDRLTGADESDRFFACLAAFTVAGTVSD